MNKLLSIVVLGLLSTSFVYAAATDDNEIRIDQTGDTLVLYIDQVGFGNKIGLTNYSGSPADMTIVGSSLTFNIDQIGNQNKIWGPLKLDSSSLTFNLTGDSNSVDWDIGTTGSSDTTNYAFAVTGDSNTFDIDQGKVGASAERLDADLVLIGNSNVFDLDFETDDITWNFDITGDSNNVNTLQKDGSQKLTVELVGDSANIDINQLSGTCAASGGGCATPDAIINLDITSDNAVIQITQKDSGSDS
jgi:hypothetical protein